LGHQNSLKRPSCLLWFSNLGRHTVTPHYDTVLHTNTTLNVDNLANKNVQDFWCKSVQIPHWT
jgi:hypothetical protein